MCGSQQGSEAFIFFGAAFEALAGDFLVLGILKYDTFCPICQNFSLNMTFMKSMSLNLGNLKPPPLARLQVYIFETCKKSNSTGVSRPKMETKTVTFPLASSIAETVPRRSVNGPSMMRTASPRVKAAWNFGADC